jgi:hypothetical protein
LVVSTINSSLNDWKTICTVNGVYEVVHYSEVNETGNLVRNESEVFWIMFSFVDCITTNREVDGITLENNMSGAIEGASDYISGVYCTTVVSWEESSSLGAINSVGPVNFASTAWDTTNSLGLCCVGNKVKVKTLAIVSGIERVWVVIL